MVPPPYDSASATSVTLERTCTGSSEGRAVSIAASGGREIRACRALLVKAFALRGYQLLSLTVEGERAAAAHWRVEIHSKITGARVPTELVDLLKVRNGRIASCVEFFVPDAPA